MAHISLPPELERFANEAIADGRFQNLSAVVAAGVELLRQREAASADLGAYLRQELLESVRAAEKNAEINGYLSLDEIRQDANALIAEMAGSHK